jgi:hypothetical protein
MAHVNSTEVQTTEGVVTLTKTSTHRDYEVASVAVFADGTETLLSWHLTEAAGVRYTRSAEAQRIASYKPRHEGGPELVGLELRPVTVTLTGKDKPAEAPVEDFTPQTEAEEAAQEATQPGLTTECRCQCGQQVSKGKLYRPGHDARHAASTARLLSQGRTEGWDASQLNHLVESLPTNALRLKSLAQAHRLDEKAAAKQAK